MTHRVAEPGDSTAAGPLDGRPNHRECSEGEHRYEDERDKPTETSVEPNTP